MSRFETLKPFDLLLAFGLVSLGTATATGGSLLNAGVAAAAQAIDAMADRSPGVRAEALITKGKPRIDVRRVARALPRVRNPRTVAPPIAGPAAVGQPAAATGPAPILVAPEESAPALLAGGPAVGGVFGGTPGPGGTFFPGAFGGGGGGGGILVVPPAPPTGDTPVTPPIATAPVPEPASWVMMIVGFAAAGAAVRKGGRGEAMRG